MGVGVGMCTRPFRRTVHGARRSGRTAGHWTARGGDALVACRHTFGHFTRRRCSMSIHPCSARRHPLRLRAISRAEDFMDKLRMYASELIGTFVLVLIGVGAVNGANADGPTAADHLAIATAFGIAVAVVVAAT